jgi:TRAP-type C4-dicarboxylate transport system substrate-binding protein
MTVTRRDFVAGALGATALTAFPGFRAFAQAADELKLSTFVAPNHIIYANVLTPWAAELAKKSANKLTVKMYPAMQLGGTPPQLYRQMAQGISDICFSLPGYTSADFPMMALTELPGTANSAEDGTKKLWSHFDKFLARDFKEAKVLMLWNSDTASLMSKNKPIKTLEDMKGLKIRTPSAAQSAQIEALGATPIDMPANQIYNNLDRGVIDAAMIPMSAAIDFKLIEVAKYFTVNAPLGRSPFMVCLNKARYDKLPAELKKAVDETTGLALSLKGAQTYDKQNDEAIAAAKKDREIVMLSDAERKRWLDAFKPLINKSVADGEKAGLPAKGLIGAYGLAS